MRLLSNISLSLRNFDWVMLVSILILTAIGLASIYSVDLSRGEELVFFSKQIISLSLGIIIFFVASFLHVSFYRSFAKLAYLVSLLLLVAVLFFGETIRGTTGWFKLEAFSFQPAEFAKLGLILFLAWLISRYGRRFDRWQFVFVSAAVAFLLAGLILIQPDLGSALILIFIWLGLLFLTGTKKRYILIVLLAFTAVFLLGWTFLFADYQKERLLSFIDPARDPLGAGYNVAQSIIAIGSGKLFGRGLGFGSQSQLHFLPEAQTDFIFSVIAEELGLVGASIILVLYFVMLWRLLRIARGASDDFSAYLVLGILLLFFIQMLINIGGAAGLLPVTGITLPFVSYGGSSLIINLLLLGIAQSVSRSRA